MKAGIATADGLELRRDVPVPMPTAAEVLVKVHAAGLNRADLSAAKASLGHGKLGTPVGSNGQVRLLRSARKCATSSPEIAWHVAVASAVTRNTR